ncbi:MAG: DUF2809 domain-containing protein [Clostridia bacterium]|nr:DUF2809 domain-containing protein [Clostridia bacterium]
MSKKIRIIYAVMFGALMLTELYIAAFATNVFVRSYLGDVFITMLICCLLSAVVPKKIPFLPIFVFIFSAIVEIAQYFDVVKLLGLADCEFVSVWFGRSFSYYDIICYAVGCALFFVIDRIMLRFLKG